MGTGHSTARCGVAWRGRWRILLSVCSVVRRGVAQRGARLDLLRIISSSNVDPHMPWRGVAGDTHHVQPVGSASFLLLTQVIPVPVASPRRRLICF